MFVNRKTYYCQDISSCYFDLQIQSNPNQNPIKLFCGYACVCVCVCAMLSCVRLFGTTWTIACQAPLSMEFSRQEQWSGLPFPTPGHLPDSGIKAVSVFPALAGRLYTTAPPGSTNYSKVYMERQKTQNNQYNIEGEE